MEPSNDDFDARMSKHHSQEQVQVSTSTQASEQPVKKPKSKKGGLSMADYQVIKNIGEGAFGTVNLAIKKSTNEKVAIKAVNIMRICELNKERHILREKDLLNELKHNNIIQLYSTFKVRLFQKFDLYLGRLKSLLCF